MSDVAFRTTSQSCLWNRKPLLISPSHTPTKEVNRSYVPRLPRIVKNIPVKAFHQCNQPMQATECQCAEWQQYIGPVNDAIFGWNPGNYSNQATKSGILISRFAAHVTLDIRKIERKKLVKFKFLDKAPIGLSDVATHQLVGFLVVWKSV